MFQLKCSDDEQLQEAAGVHRPGDRPLLRSQHAQVHGGGEL